MSSLFLPSYALPRLAVVVLLGIIVGCNSVLAEEILISDESVVLDLPSVENTFPEVLPEVSMLKEVPPVAEILPEVAPEPLVEILVVPDILFADTPAEEADLSLPTDTVRVPLFGTDSSGVAVYSITTQKLLFTTFLEQDTLETSEGVFSENGEYVFFRTTDPNWCSGLTLDQCRATSTQQTTIVIANIVELEKLPEESVINEILSVEEGAPGEEIDIVFEDIPVIELILPEETSSLTEVSETIPIDTNTYVPAAIEILDIVLPLSPESSETLLFTEQIVPLDIEPVLTGPVE